MTLTAMTLSDLVCFQYLTQIKEKQAEKESGQWNDLSPEQQQEQESNYRHLEMLCRYHNSMGNNTVQTLEMLTKEIRSVFNHNVMVDRMAAMLNYFLLHLVRYRQIIIILIIIINKINDND